MTQERILQLAFFKAVDIWSHENEMLEKDPTNEITKFRESKAWKEMEEIKKLAMQLQMNANA